MNSRTIEIIAASAALLLQASAFAAEVDGIAAGRLNESAGASLQERQTAALEAIAAGTNAENVSVLDALLGEEE